MPIGSEEMDDSLLILRWIALNSLYGRWDEAAREPVAERESLRRFYEQVLDEHFLLRSEERPDGVLSSRATKGGTPP